MNYRHLHLTCINYQTYILLKHYINSMKTWLVLNYFNQIISYYGIYRGVMILSIYKVTICLYCIFSDESVCLININNNKIFWSWFHKKRKRNSNFRHNLLILSKCLNFVFIFENNYIFAMFFLFIYIEQK